MQDSGKAIQEKFALTRELNRIRPELEHLQSQLSSYQEMVAERNDLRRQLDSLEVELENEKRSRQRIQSKDNDTATTELKSRLEEAEGKLAAEKKEREKAKKEHGKQMAEAAAEKERLEERVSSLKAKTKTMQTELKEAREQLEATQTELANTNKARPVSRGVGGGGAGGEDWFKRSVHLNTDAGRKRRVVEMNFEDIVIQTPGNDVGTSKRTAKQRGAEKTTVGEKSAFSVTPFLNRTTALADSSPRESSSNNVSAATEPEFDAEPMQDEPAAMPDSSSAAFEPEQEAPAPKPKGVSFKSTPTAISPVKPAPKTRGRPPRSTPLATSSPARTNRTVQRTAPARSRSKPEPILETSIEESSAMDQENISISASAPPKRATSLQPKAAPEGEVKKRKRKLLGANSTLFDDDDDGEAVAPPTATRAPSVPSRRVRTALGGGVRNAFAGASFSPLKRDRRGVNASFLV